MQGSGKKFSLNAVLSQYFMIMKCRTSLGDRSLVDNSWNNKLDTKVKNVSKSIYHHRTIWYNEKNVGDAIRRLKREYVDKMVKNLHVLRASI